MVTAGGLSVAVLTISDDFLVLAGVWMCIGLSRGFARVSSAAMVMETTDGGDDRGAAAGIYLGGLDIGKIIGPLTGGLLVQTWGYETAFVATGLGFPILYLTVRAVLRIRAERSAASV